MGTPPRRADPYTWGEPQTGTPKRGDLTNGGTPYRNTHQLGPIAVTNPESFSIYQGCRTIVNNRPCASVY
ncbi:unnamed protein product [Caretta caretta]